MKRPIQRRRAHLHPDLAKVQRFLADPVHRVDAEARTFVVDTIRKAADHHAFEIGRGHVVCGYEDLRQSAAVHCLRQLGKYAGESSLRTWASTCSRRLLLDIVRVKSSADTSSAGVHSVEEDPHVAARLHDHGPSPVDIASLHELQERLQVALAELPPRVRAVLVQTLEGHTRAEIAHSLGIHRNTVLALDKAGRALLARKLHLEP